MAATFDEYVSRCKEYLRELSEANDFMKDKRSGDTLTRYALSCLSARSDHLVLFLMHMGLLKSSSTCSRCGKDMTLVKCGPLKDGLRWNCGKRQPGRQCLLTRSVRDGSWFTTSRLGLHQIMAIAQELLLRSPRISIARQVRVTVRTVTCWTYTVRETVVDYLEHHSEAVGGPGSVVEVDESEFGRRIYNRGHFVEGQWVLGGIDRSSGKAFLVASYDRTSEALTLSLKRWVLPGTTVHTDCWVARDRLGELNYRHLVDDHHLCFVHPDSGKTAYKGWRHDKHVPPCFRSKLTFQSYLGHHLFHRLVKAEGEDIFLRFLYQVSRVDWETMEMTRTKGTRDSEPSTYNDLDSTDPNGDIQDEDDTNPTSASDKPSTDRLTSYI